ncbi:hypothetical protein [Aureimonas sp. SK2]|uniref:hypothetical protein n=1 Tax=Aureimonas sp. SK2 TaxID=3015992 RepID=UPI002443C5BE|nr:hypothetical protein [Aureimonas sp. SK2]
MSDPSEEFPPETDEFLRGVLASIQAAEDHLGLRRAVIINLIGEASFVFMIGVYGVIEPILNDLLAGQIMTIRTKHKPFPEAQEGARKFVQKQAFIQKAALLRDIGLLAKDEYQFLDAVAFVRNRYGHNVRNLSRPIIDVVADDPKKSKQILIALSGVKGAGFDDKELQNERILRFLILSELSRFLSSALHTLKPPPSTAMGGLFGLGLLGRKGAGLGRGQLMPPILSTKSMIEDDPQPNEE